jgi:hypothetical protein
MCQVVTFVAKFMVVKIMIHQWIDDCNTKPKCLLENTCFAPHYKFYMNCTVAESRFRDVSNSYNTAEVQNILQRRKYVRVKRRLYVSLAGEPLIRNQFSIWPIPWNKVLFKGFMSVRFVESSPPFKKPEAMVHCRIQNSPPIDLFLSQTNPIRILSSLRHKYPYLYSQSSL